MSTTITFDIVKWESEHSPRSDKKNFKWFKMQNQYFSDQEIYGLSMGAKYLFIFLLCEASRQNNSTITLRVDYIANHTKLDEKEIVNSFKELFYNRLVRGSTSLNGAQPRLRNSVFPRREEKRREENREEENRDSASMRLRHEKGDVEPNGSCEPDGSPHPFKRELESQDKGKRISLFEIWNETVQRLPKCRINSQSRVRSARLALKRVPAGEDCEAYWRNVFTQADQTKFLTGENDRNWVANFDFVIRGDNAVKILEGAYSGGAGNGKSEWRRKFLEEA